MDFRAVFSENRWQNLQDAISQATGMAIITVDYKGIPVTRHSGRQRFCGLVRQDAELSLHCQKCDSRGGLESVRLNRPYIYLCHFNILDAAIPVIVDGEYLGAVMVGEVFLPTQEEMRKLEQICIPSNKKKLEKQSKQYDAYYQQIPTMPLEQVQNTVNMLHQLCNYLVAEMLEKNLALSIAADAFSDAGGGKTDAMLSKCSVGSIERLKQTIDKAIADAHAKGSSDLSEDCRNKVLKPAFIRIARNASEYFSLQEMAGLCHVSPGYFSKLFFRETGEKFSVFMLQRKINCALRLLDHTDKSIFEIAMSAGFSDAAHFIRTFKRFEGITPARYRARSR